MAVGKDKKRLTITLDEKVHKKIVELCENDSDLSISKYLNALAKKNLKLK